MTARPGSAKEGRGGGGGTTGRIRSLAGLYRAFGSYLDGRRGRLALAVGAAFGVMVMRLLEPWPLKVIIDVYFFGLPAPAAVAWMLPTDPDAGWTALGALIGAIVAIAAAGGGFYYVQRLATSLTALEATAALRVDLYDALLRQSIRFHDRNRLGEMLNRLTGDVRAIRDSFVGLPVRLAEDLILVLGVVTVMAVMDWGLTLVALSGLPLLAWASRRIGRPLRRSLARQRAREGGVASGASEAVRAAPLLQVLGAERRETERLRRVDRLGVEAAVAAVRESTRLQATASILLALAGAGLVGVASWRVMEGRLTPGDLVVFVAYLKTLYGPLRSIPSHLERASRAAVAAERILSVLRRPPEIADRPGARRLGDARGELVFERVSVAYGPGRPALADIDLCIAPGERVVLVGPSGAGKSTLAALPPRFIDPDAGAVRLDGRDLRDTRLADLRARVAILLQEPLLFSMTVGENIAYGAPDGREPDVAAAVEAAGIGDIIAALPEGLETRVGEGGATLSGGQRQCVAIARAMVRDAAVVILDEPVTGLDTELADAVLTALARLTEGRTVLMVTHDARVMRPGDRVVRLEAGRIVDERIWAAGDRLAPD